MTTFKSKGSILMPSTDEGLSRRDFFNGTATLVGGVVAASSIFPAPARSAFDTNYDPRRDGVNYITSVKDQDDPDPCNSCTAYAVVAAVEATYNRKNRLPGTQGADLDEKDLFSAPQGPGNCEVDHWWPKKALAYCERPGLKWQSGSNPPVQIKPPKNLLDDTNLNLTQRNMKEHIFNIGPVIAIMVQYEDFYAFGDTFSGTSNNAVYRVARRRPPRIVGGHAIAVVGYSGNDHWICKNSWSDAWNGDGYVRVAQGKGNTGETYIDRIDVWGVELA